MKNRKCPRLGLVWGHSRTKIRELCCRAAMGPDESAPSMSRPGIVDGAYGLPPCHRKRNPGPIRNLPLCPPPDCLKSRLFNPLRVLFSHSLCVLSDIRRILDSQRVVRDSLVLSEVYRVIPTSILPFRPSVHPLSAGSLHVSSYMRGSKAPSLPRS